MKVTVFGASGKTGSQVVRECVSRNWECVAFVRDAKKMTEGEGVQIVEGDARDPKAVQAALEGSEAVLCCLGMNDISVASTDFSESVKTIVAAMQAHGPRRILAIASAGALEHMEGGYRGQRNVPLAYKNVTSEHIRNHQTLQGSNLQWTLLCAMNLREDIPAGKVKFWYEDLPPGSDETGVADLARTMADLVANSVSFGKRAGIVSYR